MHYEETKGIIVDVRLSRVFTPYKLELTLFTSPSPRLCCMRCCCMSPLFCMQMKISYGWDTHSVLFFPPSCHQKFLILTGTRHMPMSVNAFNKCQVHTNGRPLIWYQRIALAIQLKISVVHALFNEWTPFQYKMIFLYIGFPLKRWHSCETVLSL